VQVINEPIGAKNEPTGAKIEPSGISPFRISDGIIFQHIKES
jgi:hypothetical protein